jgi:hypothetical protein
VVEVDTATGRVASEVLLGVRDALYRAERYDGCALLRGTRFCPATSTRAAELAPLFGG